MTFFNWEPRLSVGVTPMDDQHKTLIGLMNTLHERNAANAPRRELLDIVDELAARTASHFAEEERFMESFGYAEIGTHKAIHRRLLEKLEESRVDLAKSNAGVPDKVFIFLRMWLTSHIAGIDAKYGAAAPNARR